MGTAQYRKDMHCTSCQAGNDSCLAVGNGSPFMDLNAIGVDPVRLRTREQKH